MYALWNLLRPQRPESVTLSLTMFRYDPGRVWLWGVGRMSRNRWPYGSWPQQPFDATSWSQPKQPVEISRTELPPFQLERAGERQRLTFDRGADRIEIGACLREPEREWLFDLLEDWRETGLVRR